MQNKWLRSLYAGGLNLMSSAAKMPAMIHGMTNFNKNIASRLATSDPSQLYNDWQDWMLPPTYQALDVINSGDKTLDTKTPEYLYKNKLTKAIDRAQQEVSYVQERWGSKGDNFLSIWDRDKMEAVEYIAHQALINAPQQIVTLAMGFSGNPTAGLSVLAALSGSEAYGQGMENDADPIMATLNAVGNGFIEAGTEHLGTFSTTKNLQKMMLKEFGEVGLKKNMRAIVKPLFKETLKAIGTEGLEETLAQIGQESLAHITDVQKTNMRNLISNTIEATLVGAVMGGTMTSPAVGTKMLLDRKANKDIRFRAEQASKHIRNEQERAKAYNEMVEQEVNNKIQGVADEHGINFLHIEKEGIDPSTNDRAYFTLPTSLVGTDNKVSLPISEAMNPATLPSILRFRTMQHNDYKKARMGTKIKQIIKSSTLDNDSAVQLLNDYRDNLMTRSTLDAMTNTYLQAFRKLGSLEEEAATHKEYVQIKKQIAEEKDPITLEALIKRRTELENDKNSHAANLRHLAFTKANIANTAFQLKKIRKNKLVVEESGPIEFTEMQKVGDTLTLNDVLEHKIDYNTFTQEQLNAEYELTQKAMYNSKHIAKQAQKELNDLIMDNSDNGYSELDNHHRQTYNSQEDANIASVTYSLKWLGEQQKRGLITDKAEFVDKANKLLEDAEDTGISKEEAWKLIKEGWGERKLKSNRTTLSANAENVKADYKARRKVIREAWREHFNSKKVLKKIAEARYKYQKKISSQLKTLEAELQTNIEDAELAARTEKLRNKIKDFSTDEAQMFERLDGKDFEVRRKTLVWQKMILNMHNTKIYNKAARESDAAIYRSVDLLTNPDVLKKPLSDVYIQGYLESQEMLEKNQRDTEEYKRKRIEELKEQYKDEVVWDALSAEEKALYQHAQNLTPQERIIRDSMLLALKEQGKEMLKVGAISKLRRYYFPRKLQSTVSDEFHMKNTQFTNNMKKRKFETTAEALATGRLLLRQSATQNYLNAALDNNRAVSDREFINELRQLREGEFFSEEKLPGYGQLHKDLKNFGGVYVPKEFVPVLNNLFLESYGRRHETLEFGGKDWKPLIHSAIKFNATLKSLKLTTSLFHHFAYMASYMLFVHNKPLKQWNPLSAYKDGVQAILNSHPDLRKYGVNLGLTLGLQQEWDEVIMHEKTAFGRLLDKDYITKGIKDTLINFRDDYTRFLFSEFGAGLKAQSFIIEFTNSVNAFIKKNGREPTESEKKQIGANIAELINDDFGGLHLRRKHRNPTLQAGLRFMLLGPDWTESNIALLLKGMNVRGYLTKDQKTQLYGKMWAGMLMKTVFIWLAFNLLGASLVGGDDKDDKDKNVIDTFIRLAEQRWNDGKLNFFNVGLDPYFDWLHIQRSDRYTINLIKQFQDPQKWISRDIKKGQSPKEALSDLLDTQRLASSLMKSAYYKSAQLPQLIYNALLNTDYTFARGYNTLQDWIETSEAKGWKNGFGKKGAKDNPFLGVSQLPAFVFEESERALPIPLSVLKDYLLGNVEGVHALLTIFGQDVRPAYSKEWKREQKAKGKTSGFKKGVPKKKNKPVAKALKPFVSVKQEVWYKYNKPKIYDMIIKKHGHFKKES